VQEAQDEEKALVRTHGDPQARQVSPERDAVFLFDLSDPFLCVEILAEHTWTRSRRAFYARLCATDQLTKKNEFDFQEQHLQSAHGQNTFHVAICEGFI